MSFGFGFGFPSWRTLAGGFSPAALFVGGVQGAWYDPSDLSTLFTTSAGTTQCAMPGQGSAVSVGLMLDKSQGLVLGSETVTNGDFSGGTTTGWTATSAALSVVGGQLSVVPSTTFGYAYQTLTTVVGTTYRLTFSFDQSTAAIARYFVGTSLGGGEIIGLTTVSGVGSVSRYFTATTTTTFIHFGAQNSSGLQALFDNISVRALPGNHAIAFNDTTARPELRARVNLLTYSEEFGNAAWAKQNASIAANSTTAPDGTTTAETFEATAAAGYVYSAFAVAAATYTVSVYAKANTTNQIRLDFVTAGFGNGGTCVFTLTGSGSAGSVTQFGGSTGYVASITSVGNGWYRCSLTGAATATTWYYELANLANGQSVFIWGADLRPANIGANVPAYQRIADANTYDTSGFPLYLFFDGIDDSMYTPANLNLSGTDKVAVFAGVRKLSDATVQTLAELSSSSDSNNGSFGIVTRIPSSIQFYWQLRGTSRIDGSVTSGFDTPASGVVTGLFDISQVTPATEIIGRINGAQRSLTYSGAPDAGTGNFGTYPLFIGSRNNSTFWLNGHLYSLIIAGSAVSAGNISATEQWVAGKTGIQI